MKQERIMLGHGSGGRLMHGLIRDVFLKRFWNPVLSEMGDSARLKFKEGLAFSTDSFVISPLFFPGGDIGKLCVCGTINDLVMLGARPEFLSVGFIVEEGLEKSILEKIADSIALQAKSSKVRIATGDFKVVEKGAADKVFINTSGIGRIIKDRILSVGRIKPGDKLIITSDIARHGIAVLAKRKELSLDFNIKSDCSALDGLLLPLVKRYPSIRFMRDPTRGGLATTLNEIAGSSGLGIIINEDAIPVSPRVRAACELLGIDPLYVANEGTAVMAVDGDCAGYVVKRLKANPLGKKASIIGEVRKENRAKVVLRTGLGTERFVDMLSSEQLPRIC